MKILFLLMQVIETCQEGAEGHEEEERVRRAYKKLEKWLVLCR
jgi:hypothetical protein